MMIFRLKQNFLALLIVSGIATFIGCSSTAKTSSDQSNDNSPDIVETKTVDSTSPENGNVETTTEQKTTTIKKDGQPDETIHDNSTKTTASSDDKIGVTECDEYIAKYEICLTSKVPESARQAFMDSIGQMRKSWKTVAENPQAKAGLASACKQAQESSKKAMSAYSCEW